MSATLLIHKLCSQCSLLRALSSGILASMMLAAPLYGGNDLAQPKKPRKFAAPMKHTATAPQATPLTKAPSLRLSPLPHILYPYIMPDENGLALEADPDEHQLILQIRIEGRIGHDQPASAYAVEQALYQLDNAPLNSFKLAGVLLLMDTPGGSCFESNTIYLALQEFKNRHAVPIVAFIGSECLSAGVMICAACDKVYMAPTTFTGGVGVIMGPLFNYSEGLERIGIRAKTITSAKGKDKANAYRPWEEDEFQLYQRFADINYQHFIDRITRARPTVTEAMLRDELGASWITGPQAKEIGLVDDIDITRAEVLKMIAQEQGCCNKYRVVELMPKSTLPPEHMDYQTPQGRSQGEFFYQSNTANLPLMYYH